MADSEDTQASANARGAFWMAISMISATAMTIGVRYASEGIDSRNIVMLRGVGGVMLFVIGMAMLPRLRQIRFSRPWLHIARGALITVSTQLGFYTITQIPLATATVLFFSAPIFTTILAPIMLRERVGPRRIAAVFMGFVGVLIIARPGAVPLDFAVVAALLSSFLFALVLMMSRAVANSDGPAATYLSSAVMTVIVSLPIVGADAALPQTLWIWAALGLVVFMSIGRNIGDIQAYRYAEAGYLAPLAYLRIILISAAGYLLFDETPDIYTVIGGLVIIASALYIALRERALRRMRTSADAARSDPLG